MKLSLTAALSRLLTAPDGFHIENPNVEGSVHYEGADNALRFRRYPSSFGCPYTPTAFHILNENWSVRGPNGEAC